MIGTSDPLLQSPMVPTSLTPELAEVIDHRERALVLLAAFAGLRTGESVGLHRSNVDLLHGEVHITRQAQEAAGTGRVELPPKTAAGRRVVALASLAITAPEEHLAAHGPADPQQHAGVGSIYSPRYDSGGGP